MRRRLTATSFSLMIMLVALAASPSMGEERLTIRGTVTRTLGTSVEISVDSTAGLKVGDIGVVSYDMIVGERSITNRVARVRIAGIAGRTVRATLMFSTGPVETGYAVTFSVLATDVPCFGTVKVETTPPAAEVVVNDRSQSGRAPVRVPGVACGVARVVARLDGYEDVQTEVQVQRDGESAVVLTLAPKPTPAVRPPVALPQPIAAPPSPAPSTPAPPVLVPSPPSTLTESEQARRRELQRQWEAAVERHRGGDASGSSAPAPLADRGMAGSVWRRTCDRCDTPIVWFELLPDGSFKFRYGDADGGFSQTSQRSTWTQTTDSLVLSWNEGYSIETFNMRGAAPFTGAKSNVPNARLTIERKR